MITKEMFIKMMSLIEQFNEEIDKWLEFGIDIIEKPIHNIPIEMFYLWEKDNFDDDGKDWIDWYLYERIDMFTNEVLPCYDENDKEFYVNNLEDLWELVKDHRLNNCSLKSEKCKL